MAARALPMQEARVLASSRHGMTTETSGDSALITSSRPAGCPRRCDWLVAARFGRESYCARAAGLVGARAAGLVGARAAGLVGARAAGLVGARAAGAGSGARAAGLVRRSTDRRVSCTRAHRVPAIERLRGLWRLCHLLRSS